MMEKKNDVFSLCYEWYERMNVMKCYLWACATFSLYVHDPKATMRALNLNGMSDGNTTQPYNGVGYAMAQGYPILSETPNARPGLSSRAPDMLCISLWPRVYYEVQWDAPTLTAQGIIVRIWHKREELTWCICMLWNVYVLCKKRKCCLPLICYYY